MTNQELGHFYRELLSKNGWNYLSDNLSDIATYYLYDELEGLGFDYYPVRFRIASEDLGNGFKEGIDALNNLFYNMSKYLLKVSEKSSTFIEDNYKKFADSLLDYCSSNNVVTIHNSINNYSSLEKNIDSFEKNEEVKKMNIEESFEQKSLELSTLEEFMNYFEITNFLKYIDVTNEGYDKALEDPDLTEEQRKIIEENRKKRIAELNSGFLKLFDNYSRVLVDSSFVVVDEDERKKIEDKIEYIIGIYRDYYHDEKRANELRNDFNNVMSKIGIPSDEPSLSFLDDVDQLEEEISGADISSEEKESDVDVETKEKESDVGVETKEKESDVGVETEEKEPEILDNPVEIIEELDDEAEFDYSSLSNDELLRTVNELVEKIKQAQIEHSDNLHSLLLEASKMQEEFDSRLSSTRIKSKHMNYDTNAEVDKIRKAKHFTSEDKEGEIARVFEDNVEDINHGRKR